MSKELSCHFERTLSRAIAKRRRTSATFDRITKGSIGGDRAESLNSDMIVFERRRRSTGNVHDDESVVKNV